MDKLRSKLPLNFNNEIVTFTPSKDGFTALIRSNCLTEAQAHEWIKEYGQRSSTFWRVYRTYPDMGARLNFRKDWVSNAICNLIPIIHYSMTFLILSFCLSYQVAYYRWPEVFFILKKAGQSRGF